LEQRKRDESESKEFVDVCAAHYAKDGKTVPFLFQRDDGAKYVISQVLETRKAASTRAGGAGIRHTCQTRQKEYEQEFIHYLFNDGLYWFIEVESIGGRILCAEGITRK
jgi:hypothetical protein